MYKRRSVTMETECVFEDVEWSFEPEPVYTCRVTSCNITDRSAVAAFKGQHKVRKNNNSVKALLFARTKLYYIPRNLANIFPNLVHLSIHNCELREVSAEDLIGLEKLSSLFLPNNKITTLPLDLFKNMKNLKVVSFSGNLVQQFNAKVFQPIKDKVEYFDIESNRGINEIFDKKKIRHLVERLELMESKKNDSRRLGDLLTTDKYSDFSFKVENKEFRVHKKILSMQSFVFNKMFSDDAGGTLKIFDSIRNFSLGAIEEFVRYFYTRTTPSKENAAELLKLSVAFDVPKLKLQSEEVLVQTIIPQSARQLYNLAVQYSLARLKRESFDVIKTRHSEVGEFLYNKPQLVNQLIGAKDEYECEGKRMKLEKD